VTSRWAIALLAVSSACHDTASADRARAELIEAVTAARQARIAALGDRCAPEARAELAMIIAGQYAWADGLGELEGIDQRGLRCDAIAVIRNRIKIDELYFNLPYVDRGSQVLSRPPVLAALATMLRDRDRWCMVPNEFRRKVLRDDPEQPDALALPEELPTSPADLAIWTLREYPLDELRPILRMIAASGGVDAHEATVALSFDDLNRKYRAGPRVTRLDEMLASCSPDGFERMFAFVGAGLPWNDGRPPQAEAAEIRDHVTRAIYWLSLMVHRPPSDHRDCVLELRQSIEYGSLGEAIVENFRGFDHIDRPARGDLLRLIGIVRRPSARALLEQVAAHDTDVYIQGSAETILETRATAPSPFRPGVHPHAEQGPEHERSGARVERKP
jgi:hypothetical protein